MPAQSCYMCDSFETSREHAPPQCFFPTEAEVGQDLRVNLITVPSCDTHNSKKSADDEFFRAVVLAACAHQSPIASGHFLGKLLRAAARNPLTYGNYFNDNGTVNEGAFRVLQIDRPRLDACLVHLAHALYFHATGERWAFPVLALSPSLFVGVMDDEVQTHVPSEQAAEYTRLYLSGIPIQGSNPEVFIYKLRYNDERTTFAMAALFYHSLEVFCYSSQAMLDADI